MCEWACVCVCILCVLECMCVSGHVCVYPKCVRVCV